MITGNEVAVDNQLRRAEKQDQSPANRLLEGAASTAEAISLATGSVAIGGIAKAFGIAKRFTSGLGVATLDENLDHLGDATEAALSRVERNLEAQGVRVDEIERRLNSSEFSEGMKAATLQAQRTTNLKRLDRMALILANGVAENDLESESLDDMMRAATELTDLDVKVLRFISSRQSSLLVGREADVDGWPHAWLDKVQKLWQESLRERGSVFDSRKFNGGEWRSALSRLHSFGFLIPVQPNPTTNSLGEEPYGLLPEGLKFLRRLQELGESERPT